MIVGEGVIVDVGIAVGGGVLVVVSVSVGVLVVGLVVFPGVIVTVGAVLVVLQAERNAAAKQNDSKGFRDMGTSRKINHIRHGT